MVENSDPVEWGVDEVIAFLCDPGSAPWALSATSPRPDPVALAAALRENEIGGEALLHDVDSQAIKDDLGVKALGHRSSINRAIEWPRARSPKYQLSKAKAPLPDIHSTVSPINDTASSNSQPQTPLITSLEITSTEPVRPRNSSEPSVPVRTVNGKRKLAPTLISNSRLQNGLQTGTPLPNQQTSSLSLSFHSGPSQERQPEQSSQPPFSVQDEVSVDARHQAFYEKLLQKYPPPPEGAAEENEEALPQYGDSGSEASFDSETWGEIVEDNPELEREKPNANLDNPDDLSQEDVASIVSQYIAEREELWTKKQLPHELPFAQFLWKRARKEGLVDELKSEGSDRLSHLSGRLSRLKTAILDVDYHSRTRIEKSCVVMDMTISEICLQRWKLSVLNSDKCPPVVAPPPRVPRPRKQRLGSEDTDDDKSVDLGDISDTDYFSESDGLTDFIVSDSEEQKAQHQAKEPGDSHRGESRSPARKRPRMTEDEGNESVDARAGFSLVSSQPEEGLEIIDLTETRSGSVMHMSPHATLVPTTPAQASPPTESQDADDMEIETPPLNPTPSAAPQDADMELDLSLDSPSIDQVSETRISSPTPPFPLTNLDDPLQAQPDDQRSLALPHSTSGNKTLPANPEDVELIETVSNLSHSKIATSKNRMQLLAKYIMNLRPEELESYPGLLDKMMAVTYADMVQEALRAMILNQAHLSMEDRPPEESEFAMRMAAMFLSWHHCVPLSPAGLHKDLISGALSAIENDDQGMFKTFLYKVKSFISAAKAWYSQNPSRKPSFRENGEVASNSSRHSLKIRGQNVNKRKPAARFLSAQQNDAQRRLERQEKARAELERERARKGLSISDPAGQAVTFKEPIIYLHPQLGEFVKPHQLEGIQFMWRELIEATNSQGCLLAHVMGLGKTFQVICLLVTIAAAAASDDPKIREQIPRKFHRSQTLVLCPSSVIENWADEFAIWAPQGNNLGDIREIYPRGSRDELSERFEQIKAWNAGGGVLIMSYEMFRQLIQNKSTRAGRVLNSEEHELLKECLLSGPNIIVADEAHKLKGDKSAISQIASRFKTTSRIAMTASPLANHLSEYYQMVEWISPGYLEDPQSFKTKFMDPIQAGSWMDSTKAQQRASLCALQLLGGILNPKIHRADTSAIASDLPSKTEFILFVPLTDLQKSIYDTFVTCLKTSTESDAATKLWLWLALLQLCCNHPYPFREKLADRSNQSTDDPSNSPEVESSVSILPGSIKDAGLPSDLFPKIEALYKQVDQPLDPALSHRSTLLNQILDESIMAGDKVLVFSQSIPTMDYLDNLLQRFGRSYLRIDGRTPGADRQALCKRFNTSDSEQVFLISTRAGALGLNIFGANRVVIFDFLFNPTWEEQAIGRAYRLGQKKPVFVYRFVAGGTFEDNIFNKAVFKSQLAVRVVDRINTIREAQKTEHYLKPVRDVEKENHDEILGKDPKVLDKILAGRFGEIILKVTLSHIQDNENDILTAEERERVADELHMERLKRSDRPAFEAELERRRVVLAQKQRMEDEERRRQHEQYCQRLQDHAKRRQAYDEQRRELKSQQLQSQQRQGLDNTIQRGHASQASVPSQTSGMAGSVHAIPYMPTATGLLQRGHHVASMPPMGYLPSSLSMSQPRLTLPLMPTAALASGQAAGRPPESISHTAHLPLAAADIVIPPVPAALPVPACNPFVAIPQHLASPNGSAYHSPPGNVRLADGTLDPLPRDVAGTAAPVPSPPSPGEPMEISDGDDDAYSPQMRIGESDAYSPPPTFPPLQ